MAVALFASLVKPVVVDQQSLTRLTGLPLLGAVTLIPTAQERRQYTMGVLAFSALFTVLLVAFAGVTFTQQAALI